MKSCSWCSNEFIPSVVYQIYCSVECRELATKEKISQRYQINRVKKKGKSKKVCARGCGTIISIYNETGFCNMCMISDKKVKKMLKELRGLFEYEQN
jgi:hypothetical protein